MAKIIAVTNQKGGIGKTTVSSNTSMALAEELASGQPVDSAEARVLHIDLDGQGHSSIYLSGDPRIAETEPGAEVLFEGLGVDALPITKTANGVDLLHGHRSIAKLDEGEYSWQDAVRLRDYVKNLPYDYIVIDTPPALQLRQFAAMIWADLLIIVVEPEEKALRGFMKVREVVNLLQSRDMLAPGFEWKVLFNKVDARMPEQKKVIEGFEASLDGRVLPVRFAERKAAVNKSYSARLPIWKHKDTPKDYGQQWRNLPKILGLIEEV